MGNGKLYQTLTAVASSFPGIVMGMLYVWPSYTAPLLMAKNSTILKAPITETELSLLGSLPALGAMLGTLMVGPSIETLGRKLGGVAVTLPFVISWSIIVIANSSTWILVARFFGGFSGGANLVFGPMFISEVAEDSIRGTLATAPILFYGFGILISYILGWFCSYNTTVFINLAFSVVACGLLLIVAESPIYFLKNNREEDARLSLSTYRGASPKSTKVQEEIYKLKQQIRPVNEFTERMLDADKDNPKPEPEEATRQLPRMMAVVKALFLTRSSRRAFFVVLSLVSMQASMGLVPVQVYAKKVFMEADPSKADLYSVIFAVVVVAGSFVAGAIADKAGRRVLIISSSTMVMLCMSTLGYLVQSKSAPAWVTVAIIFLYCFSFMAGAGSIPFVLMAEAFNSEVQALASTLIIEWVWFVNFLFLAIFNFLIHHIGIHGTFYIFAINAAIDAAIGIFVLPETKGLSNIEIQKAFLKRSRKLIK